MKACTKCKEIKEFSLFSKRSKAADGFTHYCKSCLAEGNRKWQQENKERVEAYRKEYAKENAEKIRIARKKYEAENAEKVKKAKAEKYQRTRDRCLQKVKENAAKRQPEIRQYQAEYREANREKLRAMSRAYSANNWDQKKAYMREYCKQRKARDPVFAMAGRLRSRMSIFFRKSGFGKPAKTYDLIGCSFDFLAKHLESKFADGMTWDNRSEWHIDHRIPLSSAGSIEEVTALFHYSNLQPLWAFDNISKGARMPEEAA